MTQTAARNRRHKAGIPVATRRAAAVLTAALVTLASCRTLPEGPFPDIVGWLPSESTVVLRLKVPGNEGLADMLIARSGLEADSIPRIRERMAVLAVGMELNAGEGDSPVSAVHLATVGVWPKGLLGSALGPDWRKIGGRPRRWSGPADYELTAVSGNELILSRGRTDMMMERIASPRPSWTDSGIDESLMDSDLVAWLRETGSVMDGMGLPHFTAADGSPLIRLVTVALRRNLSGDYALVMDAYPEDPRSTGSLAFALRLGLAARFGMSDDIDERRLMTEMTVEARSNGIRIAFGSLDLKLIEKLMGNLSILPEVEL